MVGGFKGTYGWAVSDEPRATIAARDAFARGGTAIDAAVALYFTLAVTYPSAASLGGGGVCVVHHGRTVTTQALDFTVGTPTTVAPERDAIGTPGNVRGMFAMHARYGVLRWSQLVQPAESLARFGHRISRAFAARLARNGDKIAADAMMRDIFGTRSGAPLAEGDNLQQVELATVLGQIRAKGAGEFYAGLLARRLAPGPSGSGVALSIEDLRSYRPVWRDTIVVSHGNHDVHFPPPTPNDGAIVSRLWDLLKDNDAYRSAPVERRAQTIAEAAIAAYGQPESRADPEQARKDLDTGVTSFATMDAFGNAVACSVTMNAPFGNGRLIGDTGIVVAAPPTQRSLRGGSLAPVVMVNRHIKSTFLAAVGSGDAAAPTALITVLLRLLLDGEKLEDALAGARVHAGAGPQTVFVEAKARRTTVATLRASGLRVIDVPHLGLVNAIYCPKGTLRDPAGCGYSVDARGFGYAAISER